VNRRRLALLALPAFAAACQSAPEPAAPPPPPEPVVEAPPLPPAEPIPEPALPPALTYVGELTQGGWIRGFLPTNAIGATLDGEPVDFAYDRGFFAAFDRDAGTSVTLVARLDDGTQVTREIPIAPRAWEIERINVARSPGGSTEAFLRQREPELARIAAARAIKSDIEGWRQDFIWPAKGRISGLFGSQRIYRGEPAAYHSGLDIATGGSGTPFVAPADGVVVLAAEIPFTLEGHLLIIDHGNGLNSAFLHCSELAVKEGEVVKQGQYIGRIGMTGRATGPHLHWSIKWNAARLDPLLFTGPML
jgi:murein DD-endopeptidase MepM/ murein hydrolase activator NlpD